MKLRKVLIIVENNTVPFDRRVWYEATALRDAGWQVSVICPFVESVQDEGVNQADNIKGEIICELLEGITVFRFPLTFAEENAFDYIKEYLSAYKYISLITWRIWKRERFDVIHVCNPPDIFFPISIFYRVLGAKYIFDHHDLFPELVMWRYHGFSGRIFHFASRILEHLSLRCANVVLTTNESYRQIAEKRGKVKHCKVIVVRNGPKVKEFVPSDPVARLKNNFPYMVCFVGLMGVDDGVIQLLDVIKKVILEYNRRDILFTLVGDGPVRKEAKTKIQEWNISENVELPGLIKDDVVLRQYLSSSDLLVSPEPPTPMNSISTFIKIGEYMAMGKPIVAFDLKESRFTAQEAAFYVSDGDIDGYAKAIVDLIDDPERRMLMGKIGRQRVVDSLSWEKQQENLLKGYSIALGYIN